MVKKSNGIQESLDFIIKRMATKDDVREIVDEKIKPIQKTLNDHTRTLNDHTRQLNDIQHDVKTMRDRRMQLEVRADAIEKHLDLKPPIGTVS